VVDGTPLNPLNTIERCLLVPRSGYLVLPATTMSKDKGTIVCLPCDRIFASIVDLQQHNRDKNHNLPAQAPKVQAQPPTQEPQVQTQNKPVDTPTVSVSEGVICEHCLAPFTSLKDLKQHKLATHGWKCTKCPALPPFENGTAWQTHFNAVHAAAAQRSEKDKKSEKTATPINKEKINDQRFDLKYDANTEVRNV